MKDYKLENCMNVPLSFEFLLSNIFGNVNYHGFVGFKEPNAWKKHILKILAVIEKAINLNISVSDRLHKNDLLCLCKFARKDIQEAESKDEINARAIEFLVKVTFLLMGHVPDNWRRKRTTSPKHFTLDKYRTLVYVQDSSQKVKVIFSVCDRADLSSKMPKYKELADKLWRELRGDQEKFLEWFRNQYPEVYIEIF